MTSIISEENRFEAAGRALNALKKLDAAEVKAQAALAEKYKEKRAEVLNATSVVVREMVAAERGK